MSRSFRPWCALFCFVFLTCQLALQAANAEQRLGDLRGISQANFNHDASRVIARVRGGEIGLWDVESGTPVAGDLKTRTDCESYVMSPDAKMVLLGFKDGHSQVFDTRSGSAMSPILDVRLRDRSNSQACFSPDGKTMVAFGEKETSVLDIASGKRIKTIPIPFETEESADSTAIALFVQGGASCFLMDPAGTVTAYENRNWKPAGKRMSHPRAESAYTFGFDASADGKWIVTFDAPGENGPNGHLQVWDAITNKPQGDPVVAVNGLSGHFLPGTDRILITPGRGDTNVRELPSMKVLYALRPHDDVDAPAAEISPDGKWTISWGADRKIDLTNATTGKVADNFSSEARVTKVLISTDSSACYVVFDNTAFLLQHHHDNYVVKLTLPDLKISGSLRVLDYLHRASLSPDGRRLMIQQGDTDQERILFFDAATLSPIE